MTEKNNLLFLYPTTDVERFKENQLTSLTLCVSSLMCDFRATFYFSQPDQSLVSVGTV